MYADRDFTAGKLILENIQKMVQRSMKMLLMMTEHFTASAFCKHEHMVARHVTLLENRHHCIIPVMLRPCEIPEELNMFTYINAEKEQNLIAKIIETYDVEGNVMVIILISLFKQSVCYNIMTCSVCKIFFILFTLMIHCSCPIKM